MLPPLPRCSGWAYPSLISPSRVSLPRKGRRVGLHIVLFEACSAFTRVAACTLARSPYFVTRYPKASDISSPPCLLRLLPAGAVAGWGLHPLESAALSRRTPGAAINVWRRQSRLRRLSLQPVRTPINRRIGIKVVPGGYDVDPKTELIVTRNEEDPSALDMPSFRRSLRLL